jgi:hypothetical protein
MANLMGLDVGEPIKPSKSSKGDVLELMKQKMIEADLLNKFS